MGWGGLLFPVAVSSLLRNQRRKKKPGFQTKDAHSGDAGWTRSPPREERKVARTDAWKGEGRERSRTT